MKRRSRFWIALMLWFSSASFSMCQEPPSEDKSADKQTAEQNKEPEADKSPGDMPSSSGSEGSGQQPDDVIMIQGNGVMLTVDQKKGILRGFSAKTGQWSSIEIGLIENQISPIVETDVACVQSGKLLAAFSAIKGRWDVVETSQLVTKPIQADRDVITAYDGNHIYTFAASNGLWTSPTDPNVQATNKLIPGVSPNVAEQMTEWMQSLPAIRQPHIGYNYTPNGLYVQGNRKDLFDEFLKRAEQLMEEEQANAKIMQEEAQKAMLAEAAKAKLIEDKLMWHEEYLAKKRAAEAKLEEERVRAQDTAAKAAAQAEIKARQESPAAFAERLKPHSNMSDLAPRPEHSDLATQRKAAFDADAAAVSLAGELKSKEATSDDDRKKLAELVDTAFEARFKLQHAELEATRAKLQKLEQQLAQRQQNRKRIVQRRVDALLDDDSLDWLSDQPTQKEVTSASQPWQPAKEAGATPFVPMADVVGQQVVDVMQKLLADANVLRSARENPVSGGQIRQNLDSFAENLKQLESYRQEAGKEYEFAKSELTKATKELDVLKEDATPSAARTAKLQEAEAIAKTRQAQYTLASAKLQAINRFWFEIGVYVSANQAKNAGSNSNPSQATGDGLPVQKDSTTGTQPGQAPQKADVAPDVPSAEIVGQEAVDVMNQLVELGTVIRSAPRNDPNPTEESRNKLERYSAYWKRLEGYRQEAIASQNEALSQLTTLKQELAKTGIDSRLADDLQKVLRQKADAALRTRELEFQLAKLKANELNRFWTEIELYASGKAPTGFAVVAQGIDIDGLPTDASKPWVKWCVEKLSKLDKDQSGFVEKREWLSVDGDFDQIDSNHDDRISLAEYYEQRMRRRSRP